MERVIGRRKKQRVENTSTEMGERLMREVYRKGRIEKRSDDETANEYDADLVCRAMAIGIVSKHFKQCK